MVTNAARALLAEPRPPSPPRRVWRDWLVVGLLVASVVPEIALREDTRVHFVTVGILLVLTASLLRRRTHPLAAVAVTFGVMAGISVATLLGIDLPELYSMGWALLLPYALLRWGSGREAAIGLTIMVATALLGIVADLRSAAPDLTGVVDAVVGMVFLLLPAALGASIRYRATTRLRELDQVKLVEREQLARELHDTVAHHVSAIAIQAQAGRTMAETHPERAFDALMVIEEAASRTLAEMRNMIGVLRYPGEPELAPQPGLSDIERLARGSGDWPHVGVELSGDLDDLGPSIEAAIYRMAQESVTNAVRHARHATRIEVRVVGDDGCVRLTVRDDGDPASTVRGSAGYGLVGMAERAALLGGTLAAGPGPDRGWTVDAVLPRAGAAG